MTKLDLAKLRREAVDLYSSSQTVQLLELVDLQTKVLLFCEWGATYVYTVDDGDGYSDKMEHVACPCCGRESYPHAAGCQMDEALGSVGLLTAGDRALAKGNARRTGKL